MDRKIAEAVRKYVYEQRYHEKIAEGIQRLFALADEEMPSHQKTAAIAAIDKAIRHSAIQMEFIMPRMRDVVLTPADANKPITEYSNAELAEIARSRGVAAAERSGGESSSVH